MSEKICAMTEADTCRLLVLEPLYGGCHKRLLNFVLKNFTKQQYNLITMPPKEWNMRAMTSAIDMSQKIPRKHSYKILFCSSVLPLAELIGLRPDLAPLYKIVYFLENHMVMRVHDACEDLNYQLVYKEVLTCLVADQVLFNSEYNKESFLINVNRHMEKRVDCNMTHTNNAEVIKKKSFVVYFPLNLLAMTIVFTRIVKIPSRELYVVWPHRWEFDRAPEMFYRVINRLARSGFHFRVVMLPQSFTGKPTSPDVLMYQYHSSRLLYFEDAEKNMVAYYAILRRADVILSTAQYEFFGPQILEGIYADLIPVLPRIPIYEELFNNCTLEMYETEGDLYCIMAELCRKKQAGVLNGSYKDLVKRFDASKWFEELIETLGCKFDLNS